MRAGGDAMQREWISGAVVALVVMTTAAGAQVPNASSQRLAKIERLTCTFTAMGVGDWKAGDALVATRAAKLAVAFNAIDTQDGTAEAVGDAGKAHITVRLVGSYLHLMQMDPYGAMYLTTVFDRETKAGRLQAAHSRHEYTPVSLPGLTSRPEQYVGDCAIAAK
jgi:hypothetical protein